MNNTPPCRALDVNAIRPDQFQNLFLKAEEEDIRWLDARRGKFEAGHCPVCEHGAASSEAYGIERWNLIYERCNECGTLFLQSRPRASAYAEFYRTSAMMRLFSTHIFPKSSMERIQNIYEPRLVKMLANCASFKDFLEIGAGSGIFASLVKRENIFSKVIAIEANPARAQSCRELGLDLVLESPIEELYDESIFANVSLAASFEVLEHLIDPQTFIKQIHKLLPKDALFCLTTPNGLGIDILELGAASTTLGLSHINLFNPKAISRLLTEAGFRIIEISTPGILDVDLLKRGYMEKNTSAFDGWLQNIALSGDEEIKNKLQDFIVANKQSSHMWVLCQKLV